MELALARRLLAEAIAMTRTLLPLDDQDLHAVTGGAARAPTAQLDAVLGELGALTSALDDIKTKTRGLDATEMALLVMLVARDTRPPNVVVVGRPRRW